MNFICKKSIAKVLKSRNHHFLISGNPGTGKSEFLAQKAIYMLHYFCKQHSGNVLILSYKKDAAVNLREKIICCSGDKFNHNLDIATYDEFCKYILDRYMNLLPEYWTPSKDYIIDENLLDPWALSDEISQAATGFFAKNDIEKISTWGFSKNYIAGNPLPLNVHWSGKCEKDIGLFMWRYWLGQTPSILIFPMICMLAELILRINPQIRKIIQNSYRCVLIDELQDTSFAQYNVLKMLFARGDCHVMAAGDENQRTMLWADAMDGCMHRFTEDFVAEEIKFSTNFRSVPQSVYMQEHICNFLIGKNSKEKNSAIRKKMRDFCRLLIFPEERVESEFIVSEIDKLLKSNYAAGDICIVTRLSTDKSTVELNRANKMNGICFRNENVFQKLRIEPAVNLILSVWKIIFLENSPTAWDEVIKFFTSEKKVFYPEEYLSDFMKHIIEDFGDEDVSSEYVDELISETLYFLGEDCIKAAFRRYFSGSWLDDCLAELKQVIFSCVFEAEKFSSFFRRFFGSGNIPVITHHNIKASEYKVIFLTALEDKNLYFDEYSEQEELNGLYMTVSQASEKVYITACRQRCCKLCSAVRLKPFYDVLNECGAEPENINFI